METNGAIEGQHLDGKKYIRADLHGINSKDMDKQNIKSIFNDL